ncbi:uncharacterized protein EKO05_0006540 [Ascochyta rabiei]|uniref:uncharacterized protein n=1 Tax=Didymella rabiei TaxID=5454 RepID=UPI0021FEE355|nr:uncharacterized protein EKO05_0006540 [Ascochyta rabiei]UPX16119.1 hypothetical protein EKO05_0006540 [Ascochyta rabiei]
MAKACIICGSGEASGEKLVPAPCQHHWVCIDDVGSFFQRATENESLYPPKCCGQIFLLDMYDTFVPFDVQWAYQLKVQGEYSVMAKYRVYCASPTCSKFLSPSVHVKDASASITYAVCQEHACGKLTCTSCKKLLDSVEGHACEQDEDYKKFKQTATEKGFQECPTCASTVELAEACNHITCACGADFCYICGKPWQDVHGCPHYGPAIYDEEGYNQDGYHRITGLNREGRTRREQRRINQAEGNDSDGEDDGEEQEDAQLNHTEWEILQHVDPNVRATFVALPHGDREMFLVNLQIQLFEERGITFANPEADGEEDDGDGEENDDRDDDPDEEGNDTVQIENIEQEADLAAQDEDPVEVQTGADVDFETASIALAEATQNLEDSTRGQSPEDPAENEVAVSQYTSDISEENGASEDEGEAGVRTANLAGLSVVLQRMLVDFAREAVPLEIVREALEVLDADLPGNAQLASFRWLLSRVNQSLNRHNPEQDQNHGSSSAAIQDEDEPTTSMDIEPATEGGEEERPGWKGPPGGWPDNEEL